MTTPIDALVNRAQPPERQGVDPRVEAAQVATLYRTLPGATLTGTLLAVIVAGCYFVYLGSHAILLWLALHLAGKLRYPVIAAYFKDPRAAERSGHWARVATRELLITSSIWGLAPWLLLPESNEPLAALLMLVLLTLASAGMLSVASVRSVIFAHAIPMITGLAGALEERYAKEDLAGQLAEQVAIARRAVEALGMSLDTMLDVSRLDAGVIASGPQSFPVNSLFQSLYVVLSKRAEEKGLHLRLRASPLSIRSDPNLLQRLLGNIIENAIKNTNAGGVFVVSRTCSATVSR